MAKFRDHYFERETTVADAATKIIDLNVKDPISYITVRPEQPVAKSMKFMMILSPLR